jgi:hypothetical protein
MNSDVKLVVKVVLGVSLFAFVATTIIFLLATYMRWLEGHLQ